MIVTSIAGPPFGGFREDVIGTLGPILGTTRVNSFVTQLETHIRTKAREGALQAIPEITQKVQVAARGVIPDVTLAVEAAARQAVKPWIVASVGLAVVAIGLAGVVYFKRR